MILFFLIAGTLLAACSSSLLDPTPTDEEQNTRARRRRRRTASSTYSSNDDGVSREYAQAFPDSEFLLWDETNDDLDEQILIVGTLPLFPCLPRHLHLAQASDVVALVKKDDEQPTTNEYVVSMTVSFALDYAQCRYGRPIVLFGRGDSFWNRKPEGQVRGDDPLQFSYTSDQTMERSENSNNNNNNDTGVYQSDWIYHVQLPNLQAGQQKYWYRIVIVEESSSQGTQQSRSLRGSSGYFLGETRTFTFQTPPLPGAPTSLALVGDLGQTLNSTRTIFEIYQSTFPSTSTSIQSSNNQKNELPPPPVSQLLIAGDMAYADSDPTRWTSWLRLMEPLARSLSVHVLPGNHEIECDTTTRDIFIPYEHWFRNPNRLGPAHTEPVSDEYRQTLWQKSCSAPSAFRGVYDYGNAFYSYRHGLAHIVALNSYTNASVGSVQYTWLETELRERLDRTDTPWLIVAFHAPLYTTFVGHVNETEAVTMKEAMEPLFVQYGVNFVVAGHDHAYMRTHPLAFDQVDSRGPVYLTLGAGGNREGHASGYRKPEMEAWVARRTLQDFGYGHLFLPNATHARFQWIRDRTSTNDFEDIVWFRNNRLDGATSASTNGAD